MPILALVSFPCLGGEIDGLTLSVDGDGIGTHNLRDVETFNQSYLLFVTGAGGTDVAMTIHAGPEFSIVALDGNWRNTHDSCRVSFFVTANAQVDAFWDSPFNTLTLPSCAHPGVIEGSETLHGPVVFDPETGAIISGPDIDFTITPEPATGMIVLCGLMFAALASLAR